MSDRRTVTLEVPVEVLRRLTHPSEFESSVCRAAFAAGCRDLVREYPDTDYGRKVREVYELGAYLRKAAGRA